MPGLNVVALISGGKDSLYSILHSLEHGHSVLALANLYPAGAVEDSDSFMYQTIGHAVIPLYAQALDLPLYRQAISGNAVSQNKTYDASQSGAGVLLDETEALVPLLQQVLKAHPQINAVSTGAILSDYQRTRVESVALRLGLTPISYLWQYPRIVTRTPVSLLEDMAAVGQDSRIIKVSSGGLDSTFLWENVSDRRTMHRLLKASQQFGSTDDGAALGEGGEFETLAVCGPAPLWKARIVVDETDRKLVPGEAGSASLRISNATIGLYDTQPGIALPQPALLSDHFQSVLDDLAREEHVPHAVWELSTSSECQAVKSSLDMVEEATIFLGNCIGQGVDAGAQMKDIMTGIERILASRQHDVSDIAYTSIILRDMTDFKTINEVYAATFTRPNPPARVTIACAGVLKPGQHLSVSVTSIKTATADLRQGLHVQSLSYWAPANIGPYSQAITVQATNASTVTYIAGQIPLIPATMQLDVLPNSSESLRFLHQAVLSLQHLHRIASVTNVSAWVHAVAFIAARTDSDLATRAQIARRVWSRTYGSEERAEDEDVTGEDDNFDVWHTRYGTSRPSFANHNASKPSSNGAALLAASPSDLVVIHIDNLPRGADIEWMAFGCSGQAPEHCELAHYHHLLDMFAARIV